MREPLPQANSGNYDRPHRPWTCGRDADGDPCAFGPNSGGVCPALAECKPVEVGGQWRCDRPEVRGGPCDSNGEQGPTDDGQCCRAFSCQPVRNLRSLRGILVRMGCVFALGVLLMVLGSGFRNKILAPGPLSSSHAGMLSGASWENRCTACHAAGDQSTVALLTSLVSSNVGTTQSSKCMNCHEKTIDTQLALAAHNLPGDVLAGLSGQMNSQIPNELACAVCHQEHHGASHSLAAMDNNKCQSCHTQKFESFATNHPDLGIYPYVRRTPIAFSHTTHAGKYFVEKNRSFTCQQCHTEDVATGVQLTVDYANACGECHDADIQTATTGGVELFALPSLDIEALDIEAFDSNTLDVEARGDAGHAIANWPEGATGDFDGKLPAVAKLLLAEDPQAREAMNMLGADFDFFDIDPDDADHLTAAAQLAKSIRELLQRLASPPAAEPESKLLAGFREDIAQRAVAAWFAGDTPHSGEQTTPRPGDWFVESGNYSLRYQPTGHADPVLKAWIDAVVAIPEASLRDALLAEFTGPNAPGRCTSCHSVEQQTALANGPSSGLGVNWRPHDRRWDPRGFTRFSHAPHLLQKELRDCSACHTINPTANTSGNYAGHNPMAFVSDFQPLSKAACVNCHAKTAVGDSCTQCHNYHVQEVGRTAKSVDR